MLGNNNNHPIVRRFVRDRGGNFAIITALLAPVLLAVVGVALDANRMTNSKLQLQDAADSAAFAVSAAMANNQSMSEKEGELLAINFFKGQMEQQVGGPVETPAVTITKTPITASNNSVAVTVSAGYDLPLTGFTRLLGHESAHIAAASTVEGTPEIKSEGISLYLALDRSGSMSFKTGNIKSYTTECQNFDETNWLPDSQLYKILWTTPCYYRKIEALQMAAASLLSQLKLADHNNVLVRTGAIAYSHQTSPAQNLAWGTDGVSSYINALPYDPRGGTDASTAMSTAFSALKKGTGASPDTETKEHASKGNGTFKRYIVLMTDGEMTGNSSNWNKSLDSAVRTSCDTAKNDKDENGEGIRIFTVAFMAPANGQSLLKYCASSPADYYEPENMASLVDAFKDIGQKAMKSKSRLTH